LLGWDLNLTIWLAGGFVIVYTVVGGTKIVSLTQRYQILVIFIGMALAFAIAVYRLPAELSFTDALNIAGRMGKLHAVDFSIDPSKRYTFWSGILGGFFLSLSYFGADQSQVQRYLAGNSLRASRIGLLFNALVKVPLQFMILLLGAMVFLFYQFEKPPMFFNQPSYQRAVESGHGPKLQELQTQFDEVFVRKRDLLQTTKADSAAAPQLQELDSRSRAIRDETRKVLEQSGANPKSKDSDYVFITFVLQHLPHGVVGLLVAVIFCATMSATSAVLNALGSTTAVDFYRVFRPGGSDHHYVVATRWLTLGWGMVTIAVASFCSLVENLIEAGNILASVFYGSILGLFLVAFFLRKVRGSAVFFGAVLAQTMVLVLFFTTNIGYLWYNLIGCAAVLLFAWILQTTFFRADDDTALPAG
jgi:SSS family solute:Na+ symporter